MLLPLILSHLVAAQEVAQAIPAGSDIPRWVPSLLSGLGPAATIPTTLGIWLYGTGRWRPSPEKPERGFDEALASIKELKDRLESHVQEDLERRLEEAQAAGEIRVLLQQLLNRRPAS